MAKCSIFGDKCLPMGTNASCKWKNIYMQSYRYLLLDVHGPLKTMISGNFPFESTNVWNTQRHGYGCKAPKWFFIWPM